MCALKWSRRDTIGETSDLAEIQQKWKTNNWNTTHSSEANSHILPLETRIIALETLATFDVPKL